MVRVGVFALCAAEAWVLARETAVVPASGFVPLGFFRLLPPDVLDWLRSGNGIAVAGWSAFAAAIAACIGFVPRVSMPLATLLLMVSQLIPRGVQGFVNHAQVPIILCALVLTFGPSTNALTLWPRGKTGVDRRAYQATLVLMPALICLGYLFIAAHRVSYGGWELFSSDSMSQWLVRWNLRVSDPESSLGFMVVRNPTLAALLKLSFPLITLLELSAPLALISRRYRLFFVPAMLAMHLGIYLLMHISFVQLALLYVVFIDSQYWSPRYRDARSTGTVFFDGFCGLCNWFVDFLLPRDHAHRLRFAPLQGTTAAPLATDTVTPETVIYVEDSGEYHRSTAALAALSRLGGAWPFVSVLGLVPRPVRDMVYDFVARHRYQWFGKHETCRIPTADERARFLP